jgi:S-DNA-T family DNA segregation ATPase FtsK/SpoIIIE
VEIGLSLRAPVTGARAEVLARAPEGACLGDIGSQLRSCVLPAGRSARLTVDGHCLPETALIGQPPLLHGAVVDVDASAPAPASACRYELRVVGGPDSGRVHLLSPGELVVGRDREAAISVADPEVSRTHCRLQVAHDGVRVTDLCSANGTTVDEQPVGPDGLRLPPDAVLRVGQSRLVLALTVPTAAPAVPAEAGRIDISRPPRLVTEPSRPTIAVPFPPSERERNPLPVLGIVLPLLLGAVMWRMTGSTAFLLLTLLSPLVVVGQLVTERRHGRRRTRREHAQWRQARGQAEAALVAAVRADETARRTAAPDPAWALLTAVTRAGRLWERRRGDADTLCLRIGLADQPARVTVEGDADAATITARSVPIVLPLQDIGVLGVAGSRGSAQALARWVVAQAAVWHSPRDLQVVVLADPAVAGAWEWARWLPHTEPDAGQDCTALLGLTPAQAAARIRELTALVDARRDSGGEQQRHVLLVVHGALRALPGLSRLLSEGPAVGVVALCVEDELRRLPEQCRAVAVLTGGAAVSVRVDGGPVDGTADLVPADWAETLARALAPLRDATRDSAGTAELPARLSWTDVVGLPLVGGEADAARVAQLWSAGGRSTRVVLGRSTAGDLGVDLAQDGPHALVAGTTGSGKSELLQTLVASLALGNRPDELVFVLVDYKGGAAFGPCARLPHTVGMVTDLDGPLVERALASLRAELSRREAVLAQVGAKDLDDHRRRAGQAAGLPRLVIVVDEFASLAEELPDFVGGLVGIAMRGRSLGVHLVLATQRPEGVVSADIRANTNLRLCLAVTRDNESRDVLDSPVAARIARSTPGRGYLRTGHGALTAFQTARVGGRRPLTRVADEAAEVELLPAALAGEPRRPRQVDERPDDSSDLTLLVEACVGAAHRLGLKEQRSPWLPPLPAQLLLADLPVVHDPLAAQPGRVPPLAYGLVDLPAQQAQTPLLLDLDAAAHLRVVGSTRTGRTTALRAIAGAVGATAAPDDVHLYALDLGGGGLAAVGVLPHTGAVVGRDEPQRVERLLSWLAGELARRQAQLAAGGHGGLAEQRAAASADDRLPHLLLLLDGWEAFLALFQDVDGGALVDRVHQLLREGPSAGLHVVLTSDRSGLLGRVASLVDDTLLLRLADRGDYAAAGVRSTQVPADLPPGRGWSVRHEPRSAQVALLDADATGPGQAAALTRSGQAAPAPRRHRPHRVEPLPAEVRLADLPGQRDRLLLGVGGDELEPVTLGPDVVRAGFLIAGPAGSGRSSVLAAIAQQLVAQGRPVVVFAPRPSPLRRVPGLLDCVTDTAWSPPAVAPAALLVDDAELLVDSPVGGLLEDAVRQARDGGPLVVAAGSTDALLGGYRGFVVELRRARSGLLLSPQSPGDGDLLGLRLPRSSVVAVHPGRGLLVGRGGTVPLQVARAG